MQIISQRTASAFHEEGLVRLRQKILLRWKADLSAAATEAGADGREAVLNEIAQASRNDPDMTETDLMLLADLRIVSFADEKRSAERQAAH